jgi:hypothetical protein
VAIEWPELYPGEPHFRELEPDYATAAARSGSSEGPVN